MASLHSKRPLFKFCFNFGILFVFFGAMSAGAVIAFVKDLQYAHSLVPVFMTGLMVLVSVALAVYFPSQYLKNSPAIRIDKAGITFHKQTFFWRDLEELNLTGKQPYRFIKTFSMEGMKFRFKDGTVKYAYDDNYSNTLEMKAFIQLMLRPQKENHEIYQPGYPKS